MDRHPSAPSRGQGTGTNMTGTGAGPRGTSSAVGAGAGSGSSTGPGPSASTISSVRRNLFQSQLTRRPTAGSGTSSTTSASSSSTSAETLRLEQSNPHQAAHLHAAHSHLHSHGQTHGGHTRSRSGTANTTSTVGGGGGGGGGGVAGSRPESPSTNLTGDIVIRDTNGEIYLQDPPTPPLDEIDEMNLDTEQENERERKRLAEAVRQHQIEQNSVPVQPEELLEAIRASLRAKVAALAEDNWMYEREDPPRFQ